MDPATSSPTQSTNADPRSAAERRYGPFAHRDYLFYWLARILWTFATQVVAVAIGWLVYDITRDPLMLGVVGLVQFLPSLALVLITGQVADRFSRRWIIALCLLAEVVAIGVLLTVALSDAPQISVIFVALTGFGIARAFLGPASQALAPNLVPVHLLARAVAFNASARHVATILGPVAGGLLYGVSVGLALGGAIAVLFCAILLSLAIRPAMRSPSRERANWTTVIAGFRYVWSHKLVLGAISLDLFAVLLGGATALLPVYARDILAVGPWGLGLLRAAPGIGALTVALLLAVIPIKQGVGLWMFVCVAIFGAATALFGMSVNPWFSIFLLFCVGASDMISVYIRETLIQLATPDAVRGRVNAVNMVFIGASNELGEARAGLSAHLIGVVPAVVWGGIGTIAVAGLWAIWFPELRKAERLDQPLVPASDKRAEDN